MSSTFKSLASNKTLIIDSQWGDLQFRIHDGNLILDGLVLSTDDAAAIMLAVAESAGVKAEYHSDPALGTPEHLRHIAFELSEFTDEVSLLSELAAERKALEAEAEVLYKARNGQHCTFHSMTPGSQSEWITVAWAARSLHRVTK